MPKRESENCGNAARYRAARIVPRMLRLFIINPVSFLLHSRVPIDLTPTKISYVISMARYRLLLGRYERDTRRIVVDARFAVPEGP